MVFNATFSNIVVISFIGGGNRKKPEKNNHMPQVTDQFYHIMMYRDSNLSL